MSENSSGARARRLMPRFIGICFGFLWAVLAALALPPVGQRLAISTVFAIGVVLLVRLWRSTLPSESSPPMFGTAAYLTAVALEVMAICTASVLLPRFGELEYLYSLIGVIVGLHFLGLWRATGSRRFLTITVAMCLVSVLSATIPFRWRSFGPRNLFLGIGNALILWMSAGGPS